MTSELISFQNIFKIINSISIFCILYYIFFKNIKPFIHSAIQSQEKILLTMQNNKNNADQEIYNLQIQIEQQSKQALQLKQKIAKWNLSINQKNINDAIKKNILNQKIQQYITFKTEQISIKTIQLEITPNVLDQTEQIIKQQFSIENNNNIFIEKIIHNLLHKGNM